MKIRITLNSLFIVCCLTLSLLMNACNNDLEALDSTEQPITSTQDNNIDILQSLGFETSAIIEMERHYLIEGDILFEKSKLPFYNKAQTRQAYHTTGLIAYSKQRTITVGVENSIPTSGVDDWREEIQEAINLWNPLSNLKMTYTSEANPDILIRSDSSDPLPNNVIAAASWPMNGQPGSTIRINLDYYNNKTIPRLQKIYNMVHELGHCFGLRHTNWQAIGESTANHINGTPSSDPNSIMNGGTAEYQWNGFSDGDKLAIEKLYSFSHCNAYFTGFPINIKNFGVEKHTISVSSPEPIISYRNWHVTAGILVSVNALGNSATVILGSPITSSVCVDVMDAYGDIYRISKDYSTQTTTKELLTRS